MIGMQSIIYVLVLMIIAMYTFAVVAKNIFEGWTELQIDLDKCVPLVPTPPLPLAVAHIPVLRWEV